MHPPLTRLVASLALLLVVPSVLDAQRAMQPNDWHRLTTLSQPAMSPDGRLVAFTVTTVAESENKRHQEVWVVPTAGGEPVRYTSPSTESSSPRFSPDGKYLFFNSQRTGGSGPVWAIRMDAPSGEAMQLTDYPSGSWPRDGKFAVFASTVTPDSTPAAARPADPYARMQPMARPPFGAITKPVDPARFDGRQITEMRYKANGQGFIPGPREARVIRPQQLFTQVPGAKRVQLTSTTYSHRNPVVSPDGKWIAFIADVSLRPDSVVSAIADSIALLPYDRARDEAERNDSDIYVIPVAGGTPRKVAELPGSEGDLAWSPDSRRIAFIDQPARTKNARLMVIDVAGGRPTNLTPTWRYEPNGIAWLPGGDIAMWADIGGSSGLFLVNARDGRMKEALGGRRKMNGYSFDAQGRQVAFVATSVNKPTELHVAGVDGSGERRLTSFNDKLNAEVAWSDAERLTFTSVGGLEIEGWLMKPFGYTAGTRYPLVLYVHGGPHSQYGEQWFDETQNLAAAGFMVLYTNPRGSSGYGADFTFSTRGRWFAEDYEDLMKAVDVAAARPDVDSTRMGVTGGSYGGVMTAWITAKTHRFKAAQADRMISNWWSWYGTSDAQGLTEFEFFGKPWDNPAMYDSLSPIRYVRNVRTPTFILQSEEDHRTPMTDAEQWFIALKKQGTPVEFVRYPRSTHDLSRTGEPWLLVDRLGRLRDWFGYWLKTDPAMD
ncbi:MAG: S9 family peptidase [Gemmatimonadales bacterium]|nr:S9 family peptidase [Gemmatimonadota bacterium]MCL4214919.1 S9 family peptidase [Gemmatimonadales bacterium]